MSHSTKIDSVPIKSFPALRAALAELRARGINVTLAEKVAPRMYYGNQMQTQLGQSSEICDYVIQVPDCSYDIALLKQEDGTYACAFDDYAGASAHHRYSGSTPAIKQILGIPVDPKKMAEKAKALKVGTSGGWGRDSRDSYKLQCSIGKLLQTYTKHAAMEAAVRAGYQVAGCTVSPEGKLQLRIKVG